MMKKFLVILFVLGAVFLAGCSFNARTEDKVSTILGDMYDAEEVYRDNQTVLHELEQAEQQLFNDTMELTQEKTELLKERVNELHKMAADRLEKIKEEEEAMKKGQDFVAELKNVEEKANANNQVEIARLKDAINHRYEAHGLFIESYQELTALQKGLYDMLLEEETDVTKLDAQVDLVNQQNKIVMTAVEGFNQATTELNKIRDEVYASFEKDE